MTSQVDSTNIADDAFQYSALVFAFVEGLMQKDVKIGTALLEKQFPQASVLPQVRQLVQRITTRAEIINPIIDRLIDLHCKQFAF